MIVLGKNRIDTRLYVWASRTWRAFIAKPDDGREDYTNICLYIRTIAVWLPLVLLVHAALIAYAAYVVVIYPIGRIGYHAYGTGTALIVLFAALLTLALWVQGKFGALTWPFRWLGGTVHEMAERRAKKSKKQGPAFSALVAQWCRDRHDQICTRIEIRWGS